MWQWRISELPLLPVIARLTWNRIHPLWFDELSHLPTGRVFVGRAEIFTHAQEWTVMKAIMRNAEGTEADKTGATAMLEESQLGRFADAVVRKHIAANAHMPTFHTAGLSLLETLRPKKDAKVAAK